MCHSDTKVLSRTLGKKAIPVETKGMYNIIRMYVCTYVHVDDINTVKPKANTPKTNFC